MKYISGIIMMKTNGIVKIRAVFQNFWEKIRENFMENLINENLFNYDKIWEKSNFFSISNLENAKKSTNICYNIEVWAVQKHVNVVDLVESFPTSI